METGFLYALGAAVIWGLVYAIDQKILAGVSPVTLVFVNALIAAVIMVPFVFFESSPMKDLLASGKTGLFLVLLCAILATLGNLLIFFGIKNLSAATASLIEISYPFFVVLFSFILFRSTPNIFFFIGGTLIFIGSALILRFA